MEGKERESRCAVLIMAVCEGPAEASNSAVEPRIKNGSLNRRTKCGNSALGSLISRNDDSGLSSLSMTLNVAETRFNELPSSQLQFQHSSTGVVMSYNLPTLIMRPKFSLHVKNTATPSNTLEYWLQQMPLLLWNILVLCYFRHYREQIPLSLFVSVPARKLGHWRQLLGPTE